MDIGKIIQNARKKAKILQKELYEGLCTREVYLRIENGGGGNDELLVEQILSRLCIQYRLLDMVVDEKNFNMKEMRYQINMLIDKNEYKEAQRQLTEYKIEAEGKSKLHEQYVSWKSAQIKEKESLIEAGHMYKKALEYTMSLDELEKRFEKGRPIATEELSMYFGYRKSCGFFSVNECIDIYDKVKKRMTSKQLYDNEYFAFMYYVASYLYDMEYYVQCVEACKENIELLNKGVKTYLLPEFVFLEIKAKLSLKHFQNELDEIKEDIRMVFWIAEAFGNKTLIDKVIEINGGGLDGIL